MAKVKYNVVTHGVTGKIGDLLQFRQRHGRTIIAKIASRSNNVTTGQQMVRDKFRLAAAYAKSAMMDPQLKKLYGLRAGGEITSYNLAIKDFFEPPVIKTVNTEAYHGQVGNTIIINAMDDTEVKEVRVQIFDSDDSLMEEGLAIRDGEEDNWIYTVTVFLNPTAMGRLIVEAFDLPGNKTSYEKSLP
jgi:hypothetical protein